MKDKNKIKLKKSQKINKFGQFLYLSFTNFNNNNLWESASSCSFGFVFSFVPVTLIIITILVQVLKISPGLQEYIMSIGVELEHFVNLDITSTMNEVLKIKDLSVMDIFLGFWVIWMARKLFISIIQAMNKIFRSVKVRKSWFNQLLTFIIEFLIVIVIIAIVLLSFVLNQVLDSDFFEPLEKILPLVFSRNTHLLYTMLMYFMLFIITVIFYKFVSGTKPKLKNCIFYSILSTGIFYIFSIILNKTANLTNYNAIYGTISTLVILMMKVYFFFVIWLFFAQMVYVSQFFDNLLTAQIYLLPTDATKGHIDYLIKKLFINPAALKNKKNNVYFKSGDIIFHEGSAPDRIYYIRRGSVNSVSVNNTKVFEQGSFIGDLECILNQEHSSTAIAREDCKMIIFTPEEFMALITKNPKLATRAISKVSNFTSQFSIHDDE